MRIVIAIASCAALCAASGKVARADLCTWLVPGVAERAARALSGRKHVEMGEPCRDKAPGVPAVADHGELRRHDGGAELAIDGRVVDLGFVYVKTSDRASSDLAALAGCPT